MQKLIQEADQEAAAEVVFRKRMIIIIVTNFDEKIDDDMPISFRFFKASVKSPQSSTVATLELFDRKNKRLDDAIATTLIKESIDVRFLGREKVVVKVVENKNVEGQATNVEHLGLTTMEIPDAPPSTIRHVDIPWEVLHAADL